MLKKLILFILISFFIVSNVNSTGLNINLNSAKYGGQDQFDGFVTLNTTGNFTYDSLFRAYTNNAQFSISLLEWMNLSGINAVITPGSLGLDGSSWPSSQILSGSGSKLIGFYVQKNSQIQNISIYVNGFGNLKLDVGNDNKYDWEYSGDFIGYDNDTYPAGYNSSTNIGGDSYLKGGANLNNPKCEYVNITFNDMFPKSKLRINVQAKKITSGADLNVSIDSYECKIPDDGLLPNIFRTASCEISIDNPKSKLYRLCVYAKGGDYTADYYSVPFEVYLKYYFITANVALYNTTINGPVLIQSANINSKAQNILSSCSSQLCIIPFKFDLDSSNQINIDSVLLMDKIGNVHTSMYDLKSISDTISLTNSIRLKLNQFKSLVTPITKGNYTLNINFNDLINSTNYSVTDAPQVVITPSAYISTVNQSITFSGINSRSVNGQISLYSWDFGDSKYSNGSTVSHTYSSIGSYIVKLTITDRLGIQSSEEITISIQSAVDTLSSLLNDTIDQAKIAEVKYSTSIQIISETYQLLGYDSIIRKAMSNLTSISSQYNLTLNGNSSNKEQKYSSLLNQVYEIRKNIPLFIGVDIDKNTNLFPDITDIPDSTVFSIKSNDQDSFKNQVLAFDQEKAIINSDVREVSVTFIEGNKSFTLVKKNIDTTETNFNTIENFGTNNIDSIEVLYPTNYKKNSNSNILEFGTSKEFVYTSNNIIGKTVVIPKIITSEKLSVCGDGICAADEDANSCPQDCSKKRPWAILIIIFVVVILGVFYINFYKGPGNFRDLGNSLSIKFRKKRLFTNKQDIINLSNYVKGVLMRGYKEDQIRLALSKKGWTRDQVDYAFRQSKGMQKFK